MDTYLWKWMLLQQTYFFSTKNLKMWNWQLSVSSNEQKNSNFEKHTPVEMWLYDSIMLFHQWIKGIESFMPTIPDSIGLLNKEESHRQ